MSSSATPRNNVVKIEILLTPAESDALAHFLNSADLFSDIRVLASSDDEAHCLRSALKEMQNELNAKWVIPMKAKVLRTDFTYEVIDDIMRKRLRQIDRHGFSLMHDDEQTHAELALAAIAYIQTACNSELNLTPEELQVYWPWLDDPLTTDIDPANISQRREYLITAAALLVAEIERLDRAR